MTNNATVVTAERFMQGIVYEDFISQINVNQDRFSECYSTATEVLTEEDASFFKKAVENGCARVLVLGEDWCPDVYRGMPVIARIAEVSGMDMRVFPRDTNLDIMDEFLNGGEHRSIPALVFYNSDQEYLAHWIERPALATTEMAEITQSLERDMAGQDEQAVRQARRERVNARFKDWQRETVKELRELLGQILAV